MLQLFNQIGITYHAFNNKQLNLNKVLSPFFGCLTTCVFDDKRSFWKAVDDEWDRVKSANLTSDKLFVYEPKDRRPADYYIECLLIQEESTGKYQFGSHEEVVSGTALIDFKEFLKSFYITAGERVSADKDHVSDYAHPIQSTSYINIYVNSHDDINAEHIESHLGLYKINRVIESNYCFEGEIIPSESGILR